MRTKATITLDRDKVDRARALVGGRTMSDTLEIALDRLIESEQLRHDIAAYTSSPPSGVELAVGDLPVAFDLGDDDVDYDALYGQP